MSQLTPTRAAALELGDERRAMREGHAFLDEKCLLLASEMLLQLARYAQLESEVDQAQGDALAALRSAVARHGLDGLQIYPVPTLEARLDVRMHRLMGVPLHDAKLELRVQPQRDGPFASPEAGSCATAFGALSIVAAQLAAVTGNLLRLHREYERSVRRARALHDVLLPELDGELRDMETRLEELEQEDAIRMRGP